MNAPFGVARTPARPGPGPTPEALLRALDISIGQRIHGLVAGEFRAHELGGGTELAQVRPYEPGDDVRRIDWNVTARTTIPHVRVHVPERSLTTWLLLDLSASMWFGTADRRKIDVAEGVAIAIGHLSTQRGNRIGLLTFGSESPRRVPPRSGRTGLLAILAANRDMNADAPTGVPEHARSPRSALRYLTAGAAPGGLVCIVSDFRGPDLRDRLLGAVAARHELLAIEVRDQREDFLPDVGELTLIDGETGREVRVDTSSVKLRERFAAAAAAERASLAADLRRLGARHMVVSTSGDWLRSLAGQLRVGRTVR
jgi:uncharacterized protein (DUF58 family)